MEHTKGKTIRLFLVGGSVKGLRTAEIMNWSGKVFACPRAEIAELAKRQDVARTGIYMLIGQDPEEDKLRVYVGESHDVLWRLAQHEAKGEKDFWTDTVICVNKDDNLTKAHGLYLEARLIELVKWAGRAVLHLGEHLKSGQSWSPENRPVEGADTVCLQLMRVQVQGRDR